MYIIQLGQSYLSDYVGFFDTKNDALKWLDENDLNSDCCKIIFVTDKSDY